MLAIELSCGLWCESRHLQLAYHETVLVYGIYDLPCFSIGIWLNHGKCSLPLALKPLSCEKISILYELELSGKDCDN